MCSSLMFSLNIKRVCSGAGAQGYEPHPRIEALLRQNKPLVVPSPWRGEGGNSDSQSCWEESLPHRDLSLSHSHVEDRRMVEN